MGKSIITTIFEKLKITDPSRNEKAGYFLMHDAETKEVCAVPEAAILAKVNNRIDGIIYPDGFTKTTEINRVGNTVTIAPLDFEWRIQLNPYTNADEYTKTFDATESPELKRIDTLAATTGGTIVYYKGEEDEFFVKPPRIPTTQLRLSDFSIFGDDVQEHTEPIVSEVYTLAEKEKLAALDISGKEDSFNKVTDVESNKTSNVFYASVKAVYNWGVGLFQKKSTTQFVVTTSQNFDSAWNGGIVLIKGNVTLTVPTTLSADYNVNIFTCTGFTLNWAITSPKVWANGTPAAVGEKTMVHVFVENVDPTKIYVSP